MEFPTQCFGCPAATANFSQYEKHVQAEGEALAKLTIAETALQQENNPDQKASLARQAQTATTALGLAGRDRQASGGNLQHKDAHCTGYNKKEKRCGLSR